MSSLLLIQQLDLFDLFQLIKPLLASIDFFFFSLRKRNKRCASFGDAGCYVTLSLQCVFVLSTLDGHPLTASFCLVVFSRRKAVADAVSESPW